jgi:hypothetical protein
MGRYVHTLAPDLQVMNRAATPHEAGYVWVAAVATPEESRSVVV